MRLLRLNCHSRLLAFVMLLGATTLFAQDTDPTIRAVQMVDDAPAADIYFDNVQPAAIRNLGFPDASNVLTFSPGSHNVKVAPAGLPIAAALIDTNLTLNADSSYTFLATGRISTLDIGGVTLVRAKTLTAPAGSTLVRFLHAAKGSGQFLVSVVDVAGNQTDSPQLRFRRSTEYEAIPSGLTRVVVRSSQGDTIYDASGVLPQNALVTLIAAGDTASSTFKIYVLIDSHAGTLSPLDTLRAAVNTEQGKLRFTNFLNGAPEGVDFYIGNESTPSIPDLNYASATGSVTYPSGTRRVRVTRQGASPDAAVIDQEIEIIGGLSRSGILMGDLSNQSQSLLLLTADATANPSPGRSSLRLINAYFDDTVVNVNVRFADASNRTVNSSGYGGFTQYENAYPGVAEVTLTRPGETVPFLRVEGNIPVDSIFTLVIAPDPTTGEYRVYILNDGQEGAQSPLRQFGVISGVVMTTSSTSMSVAPNPTTDHAVISLSVDRSLELTAAIISSLGEKVLEIRLGDVEIGEYSRSIDLSGIASGSYLLVLSDGTNVLGVHSVIIVR